MQGSDRVVKILLLGFASPLNEGEVKQLLRDWGYSVYLTARQAPGENDTDFKPHVVMPVFGSCRPDKGELMRILQPYRGVPCLGVFFGSLAQEDLILTELCSELLCWPCDRNEFSLRLSRALQISDKPESDRADDFPNLLGKSRVFKNVLQQIDIFTQCSAPVLIEGETGTGKEMVARAIHYKSQRASRPFIPVNCGALPDSLVENELFGHAKGAYTDAKSAQAGLVAQAGGGTLFLDEIEALSAKAQVALLRFLQEQTFRPLGSDRTIQVDVRIIAACNENIAALVEAGKLRQDLFFRLNILYISLPPLRERSEDIPLLAQHFLRQYCEQYKLGDKVMDADLTHYLCMRDWPGNVRELENNIHRAVLLSQTGEMSMSEFRRGMEQVDENTEQVSGDYHSLCFSQAKSRVINNFEKQYLEKLMRDVQGNVTLAAKRARKERRAMGKLLKKHHIDSSDYR
jgi:DNA-binding NtrC family response regulator